MTVACTLTDGESVRDEGAHLVLEVDGEGEGVAALHGMFKDFRATLAGA